MTVAEGIIAGFFGGLSVMAFAWWLTDLVVERDELREKLRRRQ